jgi:hypothetical protein
MKMNQVDQVEELGFPARWPHIRNFEVERETDNKTETTWCRFVKIQTDGSSVISGVILMESLSDLDAGVDGLTCCIIKQSAWTT